MNCCMGSSKHSSKKLSMKPSMHSYLKYAYGQATAGQQTRRSLRNGVRGVSGGSPGGKAKAASTRSNRCTRSGDARAAVMHMKTQR